MEVFKRLTANAVFGIQVLIAFLLLFESKIIVPFWLQSFGRLHLLLLHLPIGLFLLTAFLIFARKYFESDSFDRLVAFLLYITSFTASFSALMGLLLSFEGGYDEDALGLHKWLGLTLSFFCWILLAVADDRIAFKPLIALGVILLVLTGHFGANLTHGEDFILEPLSRNEIVARKITDSTSVFSAVIEPIFERKCYGCHNESKAKGKLVLTSLASINKGGKDGVLWKAGDSHRSLLTKRLTLPLEHKDHMPPKDKAQLTEDEIAFISEWIDKGANTSTTLKELPATDSLKLLGRTVMTSYQPEMLKETQYHFQFVSQDKIQRLNTPYRGVFQLSLDEPALYAEFYLSASFQKKFMEELKEVADQLVLLNLSKMPVDDDDLKTIASFRNLEKINLNNTHIKGVGLKSLSTLRHLRSISLSGTAVDIRSVRSLAENKNLREVFLWNTNLKAEDVSKLQNEFKYINWDLGYQPDGKELLRLSPPFSRNDGQVLNPEEPVMLKHNLPGAIIRYAINNEKIDSLKGAVYENPIPIANYSIIKVKAFKDGWVSSNESEFVFFKKGFKPTRGELATKPDARYPGEGAQTLIDDKKGMPDFYRDPVWMGFREEPLEAFFYFEKDIPVVKSVTLSFAKNVGAMCMPPAEVQVWGGPDGDHLQFLNKVIPTQPAEYVKTRIEGVLVTIPQSSFACYKIVARPLSKLPEFRKEKRQKGWLMVDEIFFN